MTSNQTILNTSVSNNTDELPSPDAAIPSNPSNSIDPANAAPDVADTGRISFGAACRLPSSVGLPRPMGSEPAVADTKRISVGAACRLPVSK